MSLLNYIPGVAQVKALTHWVCNDEEGAKKTLETFNTKTPIVSHLNAGIAKMAGNDKYAQQCWDGGNSSLNALPVVGHVKGLGHYVCGDIEGGNQAMVDATSTTLNMADGIPVVGHTKGLVHYVCGDVEGGHKAMKAATRTTAVMGAGAGGFLVAGPAGAVVGGATAGVEWDLITAGVTDGKEVNGIAKILTNPTSVDSYFDAGLSLVGDGLAGYSGGKMAEKMVGSEVNSNAAGGKAGSEAVGGEAKAAAAQQLVDDWEAGKISYTEYQQKWNDMKPKADFNKPPVKDMNAGQAMNEIAKDGSKRIKVPPAYPMQNSGDNQPPQQPTANGRANSSARVRELRERLTELLNQVRQRRNQDTGRQLSPTHRQWQRETFHQIYMTISELFSNGHMARLDGNTFESLVIFSNDGSWSEEIEYQVADFLDVHDQLIRQEFELPPNSSCPTVLSANFGSDSRIVLSPQVNHANTSNVIYGIRCRLCNRTEGPCNVNYVGQTTRTAHARICGEHGRAVETTIDNERSDPAETGFRPMYEHAADHYRRKHLPRDIQPRDVFRLVMDVILLPISSDGKLRSWECFWQFFFHCRTFFNGWSKK